MTTRLKLTQQGGREIPVLVLPPRDHDDQPGASSRDVELVPLANNDPGRCLAELQRWLDAWLTFEIGEIRNVLDKEHDRAEETQKQA